MESQPETKSQVTKKKGNKVSDPSKGKAHWDAKSTEIFIRLCVDQILAGRRPGTHLDKEGYQNLIKNFAVETNKIYNKVQMKNRWDTLRTLWKEWNNLLRGESGLGRDPETRAITASDDWWKLKLECYPDAKPFRYAPLQHEDDLAIMFGDVSATGEFAYTPSSGSMPFTESQGEYNASLEDDILGNNNDVEVEIMHPSNLTKKRVEKPFKDRKENKRISATQKLTATLNRIVEAVEFGGSTPVQPMQPPVPAMQQPSLKEKAPSIDECMEKLNTLEDFKDDTEAWVLGARFFLRPNYRVLFMKIPDDTKRAFWLKKEIAEEKERSTMGTPHGY